MEVLNIDDFVAPKRAIEIGGTKHAVNDLTVDGFLTLHMEQAKLTKKLEAAGEDYSEEERIADQMKLAQVLILACVPSLTEGFVKSLPMSAVMGLQSFVNGTSAADVQSAARGLASVDEKAAEVDASGN